MAGLDEEAAKALNNWHSCSSLGLSTSASQTVDAEVSGCVGVESDVSFIRLACLP